jgi:cobalt-zinc-cadmium resistance protein CzcA
VIRKLVQAALHHRIATAGAVAALALVGVWAFNALKIEAYPDISDTQVVVVTQFPGHAAEEMEQQITIPIERALNGLPSVSARRSRTIFGLSVVEITFAYGTDDYFARQVVLEKLRDAELPEGAEPELAPLTTPAGELYRYVLRGQGTGEMGLRELQDWVIAPRLLQEDGVADVAAFGGQVKQFQIEVDPLALEKYDISIAQVARAVSANNKNSGGALLDNRQQSMGVRGVGLLRTAGDIENVVLSATKGVPVLVRDIGHVKIGPALQTGIFGLDGRDGGVEAIVLMRRGENPSEVLGRVKSAIEEVRADRLPPGVTLEPIYDRSELVGSTLHTVSHTLLEGLVIVLLVLFLFLGSFRAAVLAAVVIPLSLLFSFVCMQLYGIPASLLSLGALDFGIIVDGALVMVEFIVRELAANRENGLAPEAAIEQAALRVQRPVFLSLLILIAAYLPLFTLQSVERRLFTPMAFTICAALLGALLFTLTLVPVLASWMFRRGFAAWQNPLVAWLQARYRADLRRALARPKLVVGAAALVIVAGFALGSHLGTEFLPQLDEGLIWIRANLVPGVSLAKSAAIASEMRSVIRQSPQVRLVASQSGRVDSGTDPFGPNRNELLVALNPYSTWPSGKTKKDLVEELSARLHARIPGADLNFTQPIIDMVTEAVTGSSADLAVIISGPDLKTLRELAGRTLAVVRTIPGAADTAIEQEADQPQLRIELDRQALARYGLNVEDVQELIELAIGGKQVTSLLEGERKFDVTVRYIPAARASDAALAGILVHAPDGARVPLAELAKISVIDGASIIARRDNKRQVTVRTNVRGRDQGGFVSEAQRVLAARLSMPEGYHVIWGGQFENLDRARKRLGIILPITVAIIFALLYWTFHSARHALLVLLNVPLSMLGGVVALYLRGINLSVSAAVGFVSLFGVAVMAGVLYIAEINRRREAPGVTLEDAVFEGASAQLRPLLMLILVAMFGMLPAALATGIGSDIQRPLATVVVGGLVSTLLLTVLVLPSIYYLVERRAR